MLSVSAASCTYMYRCGANAMFEMPCICSVCQMSAASFQCFVFVLFSRSLAPCEAATEDQW